MSDNALDLYFKLLVLKGLKAGNLHASLIGEESFTKSWIRSLVSDSSEVSIVGYKPDWNVIEGRVYGESLSWVDVLNKSIIKDGKAYFLPTSIVKGEGFESFWDEPWVLAKGVQGEFLAELTPGLLVVKSAIASIDWSAMSPFCPLVLPVNGKLFGKKNNAAAKRVLKGAVLDDAVTLVYSADGFYFLAEKDVCYEFLKRAYQGCSESEVKGIVVPHWLSELEADCEGDDWELAHQALTRLGG